MYNLRSIHVRFPFDSGSIPIQFDLKMFDSCLTFKTNLGWPCWKSIVEYAATLIFASLESPYKISRFNSWKYYNTDLCRVLYSSNILNRFATRVTSHRKRDLSTAITMWSICWIRVKIMGGSTCLMSQKMGSKMCKGGGQNWQKMLLLCCTFFEEN